MKFGDTLRERSIPQWAYHNIDYDDLKQMIKNHTAGTSNLPRFIPGQGDEAQAGKDFETEIYGELVQQHNRVGLFVQSKAGELVRRLAALERTADRLAQRFPRSHNTKSSARRIERFSKLEDDALSTGRELGFLDRFVLVNSQGFRKILKKYKKWTGSCDLEKRFRKHVLDHPTSFTKRTFSLSLAHFDRVLADIRHAGSSSDQTQAGAVKANLHGQASSRAGSSTIAADLKIVYDNGTDLEVDTALEMLPVGSPAGTASYWIHPENLLQLQLLLLQHTRTRKNHSSATNSRSLSSRASRKESTTDNATSAAIESGDRGSLVVCDNLSAFAECRNSATISDSENGLGSSLSKDTASIRITSANDAIIVVVAASKDVYGGENGVRPDFQTAKVRRRALRQLFDNASPAQDLVVSGERDNPPPNSKICRAPDGPASVETCLNITSNIKTIQQWLREHQQVRPLVELQFHRCRFAGISNSTRFGIWATLDTDIAMSKVTLESLERPGSSEPASDSKSAIREFPFAILRVRIEGDSSNDLIKELDNSHLTERVRGFSLATHAIAELYKPRNMRPPYWLPLLKQDIRKSPLSLETCSQRDANARSTPRSGSTRPTSVSASSSLEHANGHSTPQFQSSETSIPNNSESSPSHNVRQKRKIPKRRPLSKAVYKPPPSQEDRYWNEFDDGDENTEDETYTIYVNPNASSPLPGAATISRFAAFLEGSNNKLRSWLWREKGTEGERQSLLEHERPNSRSSSESSDVENGRLGPTQSRHDHLHRSPTIGRRFLPHYGSGGEAWLGGASIGAFLVAYVLLLLAVILVTTGRRKARAQTDVGVLVGAAFSLALGLVGLTGRAWRGERASWMWWSVTSCLFVILVIGNSVILVHVL